MASIPVPRKHIVTPKAATASKQNKMPLFLRGGTTKLQVAPMYFDNGPFWQSNLIFVAANVVGFFISILSGGSHLHLDLIGTGAFALAALPTLFSSSIQRIQCSSGFVALWGTKLASFLFFRALKLGHDKRLDDTLSTVSGTFAFWVISVAWGVVCSLPLTLGTTSSYNVPILQSPCGTIGAGLFVLGLVTETLADFQKWTFKQSNPGTFCNVGLWSISQHPNFLGNLLLWSGIFILNAPALIDNPASAGSSFSIWQTMWRYRRLALAALSPLFMWSLFSSQASGSLTNSQELAQSKYGNDPTYETYLQQVPLIIPNLLKFVRGN